MLSLDGIRVLDWTTNQQGPVCSMILGDLGAEVIKIERRLVGEDGRALRRVVGQHLMIGDHSLYFECFNRNKKSIEIDLSKKEGVEIAKRLAAKSDVFVQNFRQGAAERLGIGYESLRECNPRLIYASGSGLGPKGADSRRGAYDGLGQARSGLMEAVAPDGSAPQPVSSGIIDQMSGLALAFGVVVALLGRDRHGIGQRVDSSLLGSAMWLQGLSVGTTLVLGKEQPKFRRDNVINPLYSTYRCADGKWIFLGMTRSDKQWHDFCSALGIEQQEVDAHFCDAEARAEHRHEVIDLLERTFAQKTRGEWMEILQRFPLLIFDKVNRVTDLASDPQVLANGYVVDYDHPVMGAMKALINPVTFSETPGEIRLPAPELGQHTEEILEEVGGYSWDEIVRLRELEVI